MIRGLVVIWFLIAPISSLTTHVQTDQWFKEFWCEENVWEACGNWIDDSTTQWCNNDELLQFYPFFSEISEYQVRIITSLTHIPQACSWALSSILSRGSRVKISTDTIVGKKFDCCVFEVVQLICCAFQTCLWLLLIPHFVHHSNNQTQSSSSSS
jgi:hypothetical protein